MNISVNTDIVDNKKIKLETLSEIMIVDLFRSKNYAALYHILKEISDIQIDAQESTRDLIKKGIIIADDSHIDPIERIKASTQIPEVLSLSKDVEETTKKFDKNVNNWIDDWRALFPRGKQAGYPIRGDRKDCIRKMRKFIKDNPNITKDEIFEATRKYIEDKKKENYRFIKMANYFIDKNGTSLLGACIEDLEDKGSDMDTSEKFKHDL